MKKTRLAAGFWVKKELAKKLNRTLLFHLA
ncbi:hypothetical protein THICB2_890015 [Thiomonas sp. CB2]|nr:hypothetical protein THICB2_890015 [Thiomonas sp. CB2]